MLSDTFKHIVPNVVLMQRAHIKAKDKIVLELKKKFLQFFFVWMHSLGFSFTIQLTIDETTLNFIPHKLFLCGSVIKKKEQQRKIPRKCI